MSAGGAVDWCGWQGDTVSPWRIPKKLRYAARLLMLFLIIEDALDDGLRQRLLAADIGTSKIQLDG